MPLWVNLRHKPISKVPPLAQKLTTAGYVARIINYQLKRSHRPP